MGQVGHCLLNEKNHLGRIINDRRMMAYRDAATPYNDIPTQTLPNLGTIEIILGF